MKSIDRDIVIPADGTLPKDFREAFGRKARVVVYLKDDESQISQTHHGLMSLAGKIRAFRDVDDPVGLQRDLRNSWERGWDQCYRKPCYAGDPINDGIPYSPDRGYGNR